MGALIDSTDPNGLYSFSHMDLTSTQVTARKVGFVDMSQLIEVVVGMGSGAQDLI